ncbi:MAG TPA: division/cell wall cluster transcriptional repressor MraZ [Thermodesulfovibrionales bacterium]|nr:division/cell wall cluster transcriptional repressor MraZ [Thermodesulfovibrionales bacterium]
MPPFSGKYYYTIDPKGRIIIPAPFREIISSNYSTKLYVTTAPFDKCLYIYPLEEWNRHLEKIRTKPRSDAAIRYYLKRVIASAIEIEIDKQGRILIPASLREDASLDSNVVLAGQIEKIELWDRGEWDGSFDPEKVDTKAFEERLAGYDI